MALFRPTLLAAVLAMMPSCSYLVGGSGDFPADRKDAGTSQDATRHNDVHSSATDAYDAHFADARNNIDSGNRIVDSSLTSDAIPDASLADVVEYQDTGLVRDVSDIGLTVSGRDAGLLDVGQPVPDVRDPRCYQNNFDHDINLQNLVFQNGGVWSRHEDGYLQQTESLPTIDNGGFRLTYFREIPASNFEARVQIRTLEDDNPRSGTIDKHTGLLFRYNPDTLDGYLLMVERFTGDTFDFTLRDHPSLPDERVLQRLILSCGAVACQNNVWRELKVRANGDRIIGYLDGEEIFSVNDNRYAQGSIGLVAYSFHASHFDDFEVCRLE